MQDTTAATRPRIRVDLVALWTAFGALMSFTAAAALYPGAQYNPMTQMLSALGRVSVRMVDAPWSRFMFMLGMAISAAGVALLAAGIRSIPRFRTKGFKLFRYGAALFSAGIAGIALVPEDANMKLHNAGCWVAAAGGALMVIAGGSGGRNYSAVRSWLVCSAIALASFIVLHEAGLAPFAPYVTTTQKIVLASFMAWCVALTRPVWSRRTAYLAAALFAVWLAECAPLAWRACGDAPLLAAATVRPAVQKPKALSADEVAALRWLDHVAGELPEAQEAEWWKIGGSQFGLFARRYNIAFVGYAAAALGQRGNAQQRKAVGVILENCIRRYLHRDVWAYSMSRDYWGEKPWAPDPCFRENVMYTGHLLQLLALYEAFTGDRRYWTDGFDFTWSGGKKVHYTVARLIDVTVHQMRNGPNGGITCEPGLMFFPCNNHPHVALALFSLLKHGDWSGDARRWERWALSHYRRPLFGGGALNLVYHVRSGLFYPKGHPGLDGWSLLWYEPWASNHGTAVALWKEAAKHIDWEALGGGLDNVRGKETCCSPVDVPPVATASFLAAAARACDDPRTAERLEQIVDAALVRRDGMLYLDVGREWRIGATANRIISLAESNGSRFRRLLERLPRDPVRP